MAAGGGLEELLATLEREIELDGITAALEDAADCEGRGRVYIKLGVNGRRELAVALRSKAANHVPLA